MKVKGKVVVVTGAGSGMGREITLEPETRAPDASVAQTRAVGTKFWGRKRHSRPRLDEAMYSGAKPTGNTCSRAGFLLRSDRFGSFSALAPK